MSRLNELREHDDKTDMAAALETATKEEQVADEILVSTSIRLPKPLLDRVRDRAAPAGVRQPRSCASRSSTAWTHPNGTRSFRGGSGTIHRRASTPSSQLSLCKGRWC
jgi:hypothetical protein